MNFEEPLFREDDDDAFRTLISEHLSKGAAEKRGLKPGENVEEARKKWATCEKDKVYAVKLLLDPIVQPEFGGGVG